MSLTVATVQLDRFPPALSETRMRLGWNPVPLGTKPLCYDALPLCVPATAACRGLLGTSSTARLPLARQLGCALASLTLAPCAAIPDIQSPFTLYSGRDTTHVWGPSSEKRARNRAGAAHRCRAAPLLLPCADIVRVLDKGIVQIE